MVGSSSLNELLPTFLPASHATFHRNPATVSLTTQGVDSPITRLLEDPGKNADRWRKLDVSWRTTRILDRRSPELRCWLQMNGGHKTMPMLITQNYGNGRTAIVATGGTWRWQMSEALGDPSHNLFWQQLLRWLDWRYAGCGDVCRCRRGRYRTRGICRSRRMCMTSSFSLRMMRM